MDNYKQILGAKGNNGGVIQHLKDGIQEQQGH